MVDYHNYKMLGSEEEFEPQTHSGMTKAELRRVMFNVVVSFYLYKKFTKN